MSAPYFSIIIVVYNGENTLQAAIDSVLCQTFTSFELLIIDGASTDGTIDIIKSNAQKYGQIKYISEMDKGIYDAMNKGVRWASGEWLYFLGSDDRLYGKNTLKKVSEVKQLSNSDIIYGDIVLIPGNKKYGGKFSFEKLLQRNISQQAIFYNHYLFKQVGEFNAEYPICADWDFNLRCFESDNLNISYVDIIIAYFSMGGASKKNDLAFFRKSLIPYYTRSIESNPGLFKKIKMYDCYWRLLRNSGIRDEKELEKIYPGKGMPKPVQSLIKFQKNIPLGWLKNGFFSKFFMTISFLKFRITGN